MDEILYVYQRTCQWSCQAIECFLTEPRPSFWAFRTYRVLQLTASPWTTEASTRERW